MKGTVLSAAFAALAICLAALPAAAQDVVGDESEIPRGTTEVLDNFEKGNYWIWAAFDWEQWGPAKLSTSARLSKQWSSEGKTSLECRFSESTPESAKDGTYFMDHAWNFNGSNYVVLDVYNPEDKPFDLCVVFQATDSWNWHETAAVTVQPGLHTVVLSLAEFKSALNPVYRVNICYREKSPMNGHFFVDNIRLVR